MGSQEQKFRVVITDGEYYGQDFESKHFPRLQARALMSKTEARDPGVLAGVLKEADAVIVRRVRLSREALESAQSLKGIVKWGMGVDNIDLEAATELGIVVANTPVIAPAVAEAAILLMLAVAKRLNQMVEAARSGTALSSEVRGSELWSKTLGIVGFGRIGQHVAEMASGFRMRALYYDPFVPADAGAGMGSGHLSPEEIFVLAREAIGMGVKKILITHTDFYLTDLSLPEQRELARLGVFFERCYLAVGRGVSWDELAHRMREVGVDRSVLATDLGQPDNPSPVEGLREMVEELMRRGFSAADIQIMGRRNPFCLLA